MKSRGLQLVDNTDMGELMDLKIEVKRNAEGKIEQGLVLGNILPQNIALIVMANPGEFHFSPLLGVAIDELILDDDYLRYKHRIREHLERDGLKVKSIELSEKRTLKIEANYE